MSEFTFSTFGYVTANDVLRAFSGVDVHGPFRQAAQAEEEAARKIVEAVRGRVKDVFLGTPTPAQQIDQATAALRQRIFEKRGVLIGVEARLKASAGKLQQARSDVQTLEGIVRARQADVNLAMGRSNQPFREVMQASDRVSALKRAIGQIGNDPQIRPGLNVALVEAEAKQHDASAKHTAACDAVSSAAKMRDDAQANLKEQQQALSLIEQNREADQRLRDKLTREIGELEATLKALKS